MFRMHNALGVCIYTHIPYQEHSHTLSGTNENVFLSLSSFRCYLDILLCSAFAYTGSGT